MESKEFTTNALKTEYTPKVLPISALTVRSAILMAISCANIMDLLKKHIIYGKAIDIGDIDAESLAMRTSSEMLKHQLKNPSVGEPCTNDDVNLRLLHAAIGMFTESGEMLDALYKQIETGSLDFVNFAEELFDNDWYRAIAQDEVGVPEEQTRETGIKKLQKRYPEKFTSEAALNRDLDAEREILEEGMEKEPC